jgi:hypothetical protein
VNVIAARVLGVVRENEERGKDGERELPRDRWG